MRYRHARITDRPTAVRHRLPWSETASCELPQTVVFDRDVPASGLHPGALGAIVEASPPDGLEVDLVAATCRILVTVTLGAGDVRSVADTDLLAVRTPEQVA